MKYRLPIILVLLITLPLLLLAWQSYRLLNNEKAVQQAQFTQLAKLRQQQSINIIKDYFNKHANQWQSQIPQWSLTESSLNQIIHQSPKINQLFLIGTDKQRDYPIESTQYSKSTHHFIQRMQTIWDDPERLFSNDQQYDQESQTIAPPNTKNFKRKTSNFLSSTPVKTVTKNASPSTRSGWAMWHWESSVIVIYWHQYADDKIIGIELNSSLLMADIIALLPDTDGSVEQQHYVQRLINGNGQIAYEWGDKKLNFTQQKNLHSTLLPYPLSTWQLEYFASPDQQQAFGLISLLLLGIFAILLFSMGYYLYQEYHREVHLAAQRVSFVSQVSHELKTPLTNIRLYAEMLEDSLDDEPKSQQYSQIIVNESQRLTRLINNVLSFSRKAKVHLSAINIDEEIHQTVEYFIPGFKLRHLQVNFQLNVNQPIFADSDGLDQIVNNLLSNVEKYAVKGKQVDIITEIIPVLEPNSSAYFILKIRDYGKGITQHAQKHIFKPFYRVDDHISEGVSGTGIGLSIALQQAERMGATLSLTPVDQGACFEFKLPIKDLN
ncbi:MAG: HAMP domain-containing histidine kinase [Thiotrichaceae bacterium]|nr:HAMP domain-containing histidine kinase [Thiotrichaceae bacterium]